MHQVFLVPLAHALLLLLEALPYPFSQRQRVFEDFIAKLGPDLSPGRIAFRDVGQEWLRLLTRGKKHDAPSSRPSRSRRDPDSPRRVDENVQIVGARVRISDVGRPESVPVLCHDGQPEDS